MALTAARATPRIENRLTNHPVKGTATLYAGGMYSLSDTGAFAVPAGTADSGPAVAVAQQTVAGGGVDGAERVDGEKGCFKFDNSTAADEITHLDLGKACYIVSDHQVAKTDDSGARAVAGAIAAVDADGVWVVVGAGAIGPQGPQGEPGV